MMIPPKMYISGIKDKPYSELIDERNKLIQHICDFEEKEKAGKRDESEWNSSPFPDVRYQMYLEYLSGLCALMQERYNEEYVWGNRTLKQDMEEQGDGS